MTLVPGTVASSGGDSSDVDSTTYSQLSSDSGHGGGEREGVDMAACIYTICPGAHSRGLSSLTSTLPRRGKGKGHYAVVRPGVPPPAPPTSRHQEEASSGDTSLASTASHNNDSLLLCDSLKVKIFLKTCLGLRNFSVCLKFHR